jgi:hypothetical protein
MRCSTTDATASELILLTHCKVVIHSVACVTIMLTLSCLRFLRLPFGFLPSLLLLLLLLLSALELPPLLLVPLGPCPLVLPILSLLDTAASDSVRDRVLLAQQQ